MLQLCFYRLAAVYKHKPSSEFMYGEVISIIERTEARDRWSGNCRTCNAGNLHEQKISGPAQQLLYVCNGYETEGSDQNRKQLLLGKVAVMDGSVLRPEPHMENSCRNAIVLFI